MLYTLHNKQDKTEHLSARKESPLHGGKSCSALGRKENFPMSTPQKASLPVIKRLPKYYRYLRSLQDDGITSISSRELAAQIGAATQDYTL